MKGTKWLLFLIAIAALWFPSTEGKHLRSYNVGASNEIRVLSSVQTKTAAQKRRDRAISRQKIKARKKLKKMKKSKTTMKGVKKSAKKTTKKNSKKSTAKNSRGKKHKASKSTRRIASNTRRHGKSNASPSKVGVSPLKGVPTTQPAVYTTAKSSAPSAKMGLHGVALLLTLMYLTM